MISTLHGWGVPQGIHPMHMGFEFPEEEFLLPPVGVESDQPRGRMLRRIPQRGPEAKVHRVVSPPACMAGSIPRIYRPYRNCGPVGVWTWFGRGLVVVQCAPRSGGTALRFSLKQAWSQGRPHFIRPTLGLRAESLWDRAPGTLDSFWMDAPCHGGGCRGFPCRGGVRRIRQRRCALQPRVARPALPWGPMPPATNPTGVAPRPRSGRGPVVVRSWPGRGPMRPSVRRNRVAVRPESGVVPG